MRHHGRKFVQLLCGIRGLETSPALFDKAAAPFASNYSFNSETARLYRQKLFHHPNFASMSTTTSLSSSLELASPKTSENADDDSNVTHRQHVNSDITSDVDSNHGNRMDNGSGETSDPVITPETATVSGGDQEQDKSTRAQRKKGRKRKANNYDNKKTDTTLFASADFVRLTGVSGPVDSVQLPIAPHYVLENGLRKVKPYFYKYTTGCKARWLGKGLLDVLNHELHPRSPIQFIHNIECGRLRVNGKSIPPDYVLSDNDLIEQVVHRHESPVSSQPIRIAQETDDYLVVDKPCSIPVHACGRYRFNSVLAILKWEMGIDDVRLCHRLDRMTSGALILAKNIRASQQFERLLKAKKVAKTYVARVEGVFPKEEVVCDKPLDVLNPKIGLHRVVPEGSGKEATTRFQLLWTDGTESVVKCYPVTGRTHQIRVHLQYLGYPITNDLLYNSDAFGPHKGKNCEFGKTHEQLVSDLWNAHSSTVYMQDLELKDDTIRKVEQIIANFKAEQLLNNNSKTKDCETTENPSKFNSNSDLDEPHLKRLKDEPATTIGGNRGFDAGNSEIVKDRLLSDVVPPVSPEIAISTNIVSSIITAPHCSPPTANEIELLSTSLRNSNGSGLDSSNQTGPVDTSANATVQSESTIFSSNNSDQSKSIILSNNSSSDQSESIQTSNHDSQTGPTVKQVLNPAALEDPYCFDCHLVFRDPYPSDLVMYLHCLSYKGPDFEFSTDMPDWAKEPPKTE